MTRWLRTIALLAIASAAHAQSPSADWRTIETAHFSVHYPRQLDAWTTVAASRLESIRAAVVKEVGFDPPQRIDVIVENPIAEANGLAYSFLDAPRVVFFVEPPGPDEDIGAYTDWIDLVATHEITHIVHLLRPSRNPFERAMARLLPLGPITTDAPRWVLEGYATVIEGRLTGAGRPPSTLRAVILREWAANGRMPAYAQLDSGSRFLGLSMAYLAGSAFLEWLEARSGEGSLKRLWARMTARQRRSFDAAFTGVFGDTPERLYGRFVAEVTASAVRIGRSTPLREGEWWQDTPRASGDPAVSPDGSQIVAVIRPRAEPARLVIWSTAPPDEERKKFSDRIAEIIHRDPDDYPPVASKPLPRRIVHSFRPVDGGDIESPRWTRDGAILFSHRQPDRDGFLHHDLFRWDPALDTSRRVTRLADVFDADPFPDGKTAVAVRGRDGLTQLVQVDLTDGSVRELTKPEVETVYSHPRVARDGARIAYVANRAGRWQLFVRDLASGTERSVISDVDVASPEWNGDEIVATILSEGFAEVNVISLDGSHQPLTRSLGGAFSPAPALDGRVFFMALDPDGFQLHVTDAKSVAPSAAAYDPSLVPALPPKIAAPARFETQPVAASRPYGIGRQELQWLVGEIAAPSQLATEVGVRFGDVVGRLDSIAIASIASDNGQRGVGVASTWRGWPVAVSGHLFTADDGFTKRRGAELRGSWTLHRALTNVRVEAGALTGTPIHVGFADARVQMRQVLSSWRTNETFQLSGEGGSRTHFRGVARASLQRGGFSVTGRYQRDEARNDGVVDVGGVPSSILPRSAIPNRVFDPALPIATLYGRTYNGARIETTLPGIPATLFYTRHRTESTSVGVAGVEFTVAADASPILRLPGLDFTTGAARVMEPSRNRTKLWLAMRWRP